MAGISIEAKKGMFQFLITSPPTVVVGNREFPLTWGRATEVELPAGEHRIEVAFRYLGRRCGRAGATVVAADPPPRLRYKTPLFVTSSGKLRAV